MTPDDVDDDDGGGDLVRGESAWLYLAISARMVKYFWLFETVP